MTKKILYLNNEKIAAFFAVSWKNGAQANRIIAENIAESIKLRIYTLLLHFENLTSEEKLFLKKYKIESKNTILKFTHRYENEKL